MDEKAAGQLQGFLNHQLPRRTDDFTPVSHLPARFAVERRFPGDHLNGGARSNLSHHDAILNHGNNR